MERRDEQMAILALGLTLLLLVLQVALLVTATVMPIARAALELAEEEPEAPPPAPAEPAGERRRPVFAPVMALVGAALSAGIAMWAALRLYRGTIVRNRWTVVLILSGVTCSWGILMARLLSRVPLALGAGP